MSNKKRHDEDDGYTVVDMNVEGMKGYISPDQRKQISDMQKLALTKKEKRALFWGSFLALIPPLIIAGICFFGTALLLYLWLK